MKRTLRVLVCLAGLVSPAAAQDMPVSMRTIDLNVGDTGEVVLGDGKKISVRLLDLKKQRDTLREALTTPEQGPKVIIAQSECMLNKQRRVKPLMNKAIKEGRRVVRERFGVDPDTCTGDHSCIRLSGCPSLTVARNPDPLRTEPVTKVINSCVGCGLCGEVAHAAVLCPSFYRASIVSNPTGWDRFKEKIRGAVIGFLQRRLEKRQLVAAWSS